MSPLLAFVSGLVCGFCGSFSFLGLVVLLFWAGGSCSFFLVLFFFFLVGVSRSVLRSRSAPLDAGPGAAARSLAGGAPGKIGGCLSVCASFPVRPANAGAGAATRSLAGRCAGKKRGVESGVASLRSEPSRLKLSSPRCASAHPFGEATPSLSRKILVCPRFLFASKHLKVKTTFW